MFAFRSDEQCLTFSIQQQRLLFALPPLRRARRIRLGYRPARQSEVTVDGRVRRVYANRREVLANSLRRVFGDGIEFTLRPGGMALWVRLHMSVDVEDWGRRSVQHGVSWYTGRGYAFDGKPKPFARFSFAWLNERELPEAVRRMAVARPQGPSVL